MIERLRHARPAPKIYLQGTAGSQQHFILAKRLLRAQPEPRRAGIAEINRGRGTADEVKAMLMKAVAAVKADKAKALDMFNKGEGGFLDRDLYVFCDNLSDAKVVAIGNPNAKQLIGTDARTTNTKGPAG